MINSVINFSDIIIYWDLSDKQSDNEMYYVYLNDEFKLSTDKTHFTIRDITAKEVTLNVYTDEYKKNLFHTAFYTMPNIPNFINITSPEYGAVGDGKTINTKAIQKAIDNCCIGDCVYIPEGEFLTGALHLHSNMEIYIAKGGVLKGSAAPADYLPKIFSRFEGYEMECYSSLINIGDIKDRDIIKERNIKIYGGGTIEGGGLPLAKAVLEVERERLKEYMESLGDEIKTYENLDTIPGRLRPKLLNISCTENVVLENIGIKNGSCWNVHMIYSKNIVTANCNFYSHGIWNSDGWDPDSSEDCTIFNCDFNTGDDCVAIKSGKNPEGNEINKPCKNIKVFDCRCETAHGFTIGSEMSGGVDGVYIWDCDMTNSIYGIEIKATKKRGSYVRNINMTRSTVSRILMHSVGYNDDGIGAPTPPKFSDCNFSNMTITGESLEYGTYKKIPCHAIEMKGFGKGYEVENINFTNVTIKGNDPEKEHTLSLNCLKNINFKNLSVK